MHETFRWQAGFTLVEMIVVLTVISVLSAIATATLRGTSDRAHRASMISDLRNLGPAQEAYVEQVFAETGTATYAAQMAKLDLVPSEGVQIRVRGSADGWSAQSTHEKVPGARCAFFVGTVDPFPPATEPGRITCD